MSRTAPARVFVAVAVAIGAAAGVSCVPAPVYGGPPPGSAVQESPDARERDEAYAACRDQEKLGDATVCWKRFLQEYGAIASPQTDYAKAYVDRAAANRAAADGGDDDPRRGRTIYGGPPPAPPK